MFSEVLGLVSQGMSPQEAKAQIDQTRILEMAKMKPEERIYAGVAGATDRFAGGLGRLLGGGQEEDAMLRKASDFAAMRNQIDPTSADSLAKAAKQMYQMGFTTQGNMYAKAAQEALKQEAEIGAKKAETTFKGAQTTKVGQETQEIVDKQAAKGARVQMLKDAGLGDSEAMGIASNDTAFSKYIETKKVPVPSDYAVQAQKLGFTAKPYLSDYTPDQIKKMEKGVVANKPTSEFERLVDGLPISDEKKQSMKAQRATSLMSSDSSGLKALSAELAQARIDALKQETKQKEDKASDEKRMAIEKLSGVESSVDTTLSTAERALKLAPGTMLEATNQALFNNIPFSDAKSMKNLVSSLNSEKALQALEQLKAQSRTGATGFGALTAPELQLIIDKTRSLDPTDKMFKENLAVVVDGWRKIRKSSMESRINLQGKGDKLSLLRSKIAAGRAKGSASAQEKAEIEALKAELGVN